MMQYDVRCEQPAQGDQIGNGRNRLKGVLITSLATGVIDISDGNGGNTKFAFNAVAAGNVYVAIPGEGILFTNYIYVKTLTNASITVFYG